MSPFSSLVFTFNAVTDVLGRHREGGMNPAVRVHHIVGDLFYDAVDWITNVLPEKKKIMFNILIVGFADNPHAYLEVTSREQTMRMMKVAL